MNEPDHTQTNHDGQLYDTLVNYICKSFIKLTPGYKTWLSGIWMHSFQLWPRKLLQGFILVAYDYSRLEPLPTASTSLEASPALRSKERCLYLYGAGFFVTCYSSHLLPFMLLLTLARCVVTLSALAAEGTKFCREVVNASLDCRDNIKSTCSESGFNQEER